MSIQQNPPTFSTTSLNRLINGLSPELLIIILEQWIGDPKLVYTYDPHNPTYEIEYPSPVDALLLPSPLRDEHNRLLRQKFLRSRKAFTNVLDFITIYLACFPQGPDPGFTIPPELVDLAAHQMQLPQAMQRHPALPLHGLEKIRLDLPAVSYFAMFRVALLPFDEAVNGGPTSAFPPLETGAATFLQHTKELTLCFGTSYLFAHAWYNLDDDEWGEDARLRPGVCEKGVVVDWILTFAWRYLRNIPRVVIEGEVQGWVREKWEAVFAGRREGECEDGEDEGGVGGREDIWRVSHQGLREAMIRGEDWRPEEYYPPKCMCEVGCWRIGEGGARLALEVGEGGWTVEANGSGEEKENETERPEWCCDFVEPEGVW
ncbi:hypothetical protein CC80DRAFT_491993 [Byssothecium circinans]|uniref:Uncharacterized protein n=1 Tax=Byssothecium circinans TaxID=147558 RepID=A0A6A5TXM5_9PLEO|nr:hypothetical protein CC80DRAFT_491993 [Byssothecium circinans]